MSYYRGDYYQGDSNYYQGDPFLGGLIAAGARRIVAPLAKKAAGWVGRQTLGGLAGKTAATVGAGVVIQKARGAKQAGRPLEIDLGAILPGGEPFLSRGQCPPGFHLNKADGNKGPKGSYCVRNRRMNPLNPRALKRSLRRAEDFEKFARRTVNALRTGPRKFKGRTATKR